MGKIAVFFRFVFSVILGFLPSFAFVTLFMRYGSPMTNYINFLSNFEVSKWAWISGGIIAFLVFLIWNVAKSESPSKKYILALIILILLVGGVFVFAQGYMYVKSFLGGDTLVQLSADRENIFFENEPEESISFKTSVTLAPFCLAECHYEFFDLSRGEEIDSGAFTISPVLPKIKIFSLKREEIVAGQTLKKFEVACKSKNTNLCYTLEKENQKGVLITVNYGLTKEQADMIKSSKAELQALGAELNNASIKIKEAEFNILLLNKTIAADDLSGTYKNLFESLSEIKSSFEITKNFMEKRDIYAFNENLDNFKTNFNAFKSELNQFTFAVNSRMSMYNQLVENIILSRVLLEECSQRALTEEHCNELKSAAPKFNIALSEFKNRTDINYKKLKVDEIYSEAKKLNDDSEDDAGNLCVLSQNIVKDNIAKLNLIVIEEETPVILFKEPESNCCYYGVCKSCCNENCSSRNYPIIFLHGHSISSNIPADYSFDSLLGIKEKLASENYIDAGTLVISSQIAEEKGLWGKADFPFMVTSSYFFDVYRDEEGGFFTASSMKDSIDTYALRLKDIIELARYKTNKDKVIIVAHSMGGVVARRYVQIFGASYLDKLIFVTTPNRGVESRVTGLCNILGPEVVCKDLDEESLFMNKLNNAPTEKPEIHNIIGIGCSMGDETGDGIIKNSSQYLDNAANYYISGDCDEINLRYLHEEIVNPSKYPKIYDIIKNILKENNN